MSNALEKKQKAALARVKRMGIYCCAPDSKLQYTNSSGQATVTPRWLTKDAPLVMVPDKVRK